jgi:hypothetical protein
MASTASTTPLRLLAVLVASFVLTAAPAAAKDFCIDIAETPPNPDFILENFKLPKKGKCKPLIGVGNPVFSVSVVTGAACASSDESQVSFAFTQGVMPGPLGAMVPSVGGSVVWNVLLARDDLTGLGFSRVGTTTTGGAAVGSECTNDVIR